MIGVADRDSVVKVILNDLEKLPNLKVSDTVLLTNYIFKLDPNPLVVLTKVSKIMRTSNLDVPKLSSMKPKGLVILHLLKPSA